jgi:hypothetical protein
MQAMRHPPIRHLVAPGVARLAPTPGFARCGPARATRAATRTTIKTKTIKTT